MVEVVTLSDHRHTSEWLTQTSYGKHSDIRKPLITQASRQRLLSSQHYQHVEKEPQKAHNTHHLEVGHRETNGGCVDLWHKARLFPGL